MFILEGLAGKMQKKCWGIKFRQILKPRFYLQFNFSNQNAKIKFNGMFSRRQKHLKLIKFTGMILEEQFQMNKNEVIEIHGKGFIICVKFV